MQGPRTKEEAELAWSAVKRAITARVNYEAQVWRERRLNEELATAWLEFKAGLDEGKVLGPGADILESLGPGGGNPA